MRLEEKLQIIDDLEDIVRDHINATRYQNDLIRDIGNWNQICSSLDTIDDTLYAISDYIETDYPSNTGLKYLYTYGLLQALFIQQDAISHLSQAFNIQYKHSARLYEIRALRNAAIGHPTKQEHNTPDGKVYYNYISRITLSHNGFTLMKSSSEGKNDFIDIEIFPIINDQIDEIISAYRIIASTLREADKMHKEKYKDDQLIDIFHSSIGYSFQKIAQGIHSPENGNRDFALSMLNIIQETYKKFEHALTERKEMHEYIKYDLAEYNHALTKLEAFLNGTDSIMVKHDAMIYHSYLRNENNHFEQIAKEIDEAYKTSKNAE